MTTEQIREKVRELVLAELPLDAELSDQQPLFYNAMKESDAAARARGEAGLDSLDRVELLMNLEEAFGFDIPDFATHLDGGLAADTFNTVDAIVAYVAGRLSDAA